MDPERCLLARHGDLARRPDNGTTPRRKPLSAEAVAKALGGRRAGRGWVAHCPAHNDRHPSLSIDMRGGKLLFFCRAGCAQAALVAALRARGLWGRGRLGAAPIGVAPMGGPSLVWPGADQFLAAACQRVNLPYVLGLVGSMTLEHAAEIAIQIDVLRARARLPAGLLPHRKHC